MFNRIIHSAFFKIDVVEQRSGNEQERLFPKSEMDSDTYDIGTIGMALVCFYFRFFRIGRAKEAKRATQPFAAVDRKGNRVGSLRRRRL